MSMNTSPIIEDITEDTDLSAHSKSEASPEVTTSIFMGGKPPLKNWKMFGDVPQSDISPEPEAVVQRHVSDRSITISRSAPIWLQIGQALAVFITVAWISYAAIYILALPNSIKTITSSPLTLGGILASVLAPIAMLWLCIATWQRRSDAHIYAEALRDELRGLFYPNADQSNLIGEDIRQLMKQATEMSASSRGAIKAIQRARTGLRAEIRDFAGVSQKAEFHIDRLAEALAKRSEELLSLTETIEAQSEVISDKALRGVTAWENVSSEMTELGEEIEQIFDKGTEKLQLASDTATQKIESIELALASAVENLSTRIGNVASHMDSNRSALDSQGARLLEISQTIDKGAERLEVSLLDAENIYAAVEGVMNSVANNLDKADETANDLFAKSEVIEQKLSERTEALRSSTDKLINTTSELDNVGTLATHKLGEALSMAILGADTITNSVRRSKEIMDATVSDVVIQMERSSKLTDDKLGSFISESQRNQEKLASLIAEMDKKQGDIIDSTRHIDDSRVQLSEAVDNATRQLAVATSDMAEKTEEPLKLIISSIERLDAYSTKMDDKLSVRIVEVQQETSKIKSLIDGIDTVMKDSLTSLTEASSHISEKAADVTSEIHTQKDLLNNFVGDFEDKSSMITTLFDERLGHIQSSILLTQDKITTLGDGFTGNSEAFIEKAMKASERMDGFEKTLIQSISSVDEKYTHVADKVEGQIEFMSRLSDVITPEAERILSKIEGLNSRYDDLKDKCFAVADEAVGRLEDMGEKLQSRIYTLGDESFKSSQVMMVASAEMTNNLDNIKSVSEEAHERIEHIQSGLKGRVEDLHLISDRVQMKVESMQTNLSTYAKDLTDVLQMTISDLEVATDKFGETASVLNEKSHDATCKIMGVTEKYIEEGYRMSLVGEQVAHKSSRILTVLKEETEKLVLSANASILELHKSGDTLSVRAKEIEEYLKASANHTRTYGNELRDQANMIANYSSDAVERISSATTALTIRAKDVIDVGQTVFSKIENAGARLEEGTDILGRVAKITIQAVDEAVDGFQQHGETFRRTVDDLSQQIQNVRDTKANNEKELFLNASKFVIESLYSLAVDVSRHMEGELDIRVLRTYQKGDISAYIRHLIDAAPRIPVEKSQRKFIEDSEFRTYVLRFIRQYEELLTQAQANDYGDLLASVFSTSDMGKLYKILCEIAGRNAKSH